MSARTVAVWSCSDNIVRLSQTSTEHTDHHTECQEALKSLEPGTGGCMDLEDETYIAARIRDDGLACTAVIESSMDKRQAFALLDIVLRSFEQQHPFWHHYESQQSLVIDGIDSSFIASYKDPIDVVHQDLLETRDHMIVALDALLQRGERIDALTARSSDLSRRSKAFRNQTWSLNSWWYWLIGSCCSRP